MKSTRIQPGQRYGALTVLGREEGNTHLGQSRWRCRCDCGLEIIVTSNNLRPEGGSRSCGQRLGHKTRFYKRVTEMGSLPWWEREELLTPKDKEAMARAEAGQWENIEEDWAETPAGHYELKNIISRKRHYEEYMAATL